MTTSPTTPKEHRSFADDAAGSEEAVVNAADRLGPPTGTRSGGLEDAGPKAAEDGRYGNLRHNLTNHWRVQVR